MIEKKKNIKVSLKEGQTLEELATDYMMNPTSLGAFIVEGNSTQITKQIDMEYAKKIIEQGVELLKKGDLSKLEEMLYSQAVALNMMFSSLSLKATHQSNIDVRTSITNLCLKAQNQSRNTIQTLINLKQPSQTAFIKQANIAHGHQQINNGETQTSVRNFQNKSNELLEVKDGQRLDTGKKAETERVNSELEAVGAIHRGQDT